MDSIKEIINKVKQRPEMFIGRHSILCLKAFLDGWYIRNPKGIIDDDIMGAFQDYIEIRYKEKDSISWCDILLKNSKDESDALNLFFKEFDICLNG